MPCTDLALACWSAGNPAVVEVANGVRIERFRCNGTGAARDQLRFVYASDYSRGLLQILSGFWPVIRAAFPTATLHIYYGYGEPRDRTFARSHVSHVGWPFRKTCCRAIAEFLPGIPGDCR